MIKWLDEPEKHDYPAAASYLSLHFPYEVVEELVHRLHLTPPTKIKAKDIFRASGLSLLGISNQHIRKNLEKIHNGKKLSPVLLVHNLPHVIIADGYHRVCAVYQVDEDADVLCKLV